MWSSTTPLMKWKLIEEGVVSGLIYVLEVCKDSPASEVKKTCTNVLWFSTKVSPRFSATFVFRLADFLA